MKIHVVVDADCEGEILRVRAFQDADQARILSEGCPIFEVELDEISEADKAKLLREAESELSEAHRRLEEARIQLQQKLSLRDRLL